MLVVAGGFGVADARDSQTAVSVNATVLAMARIERQTGPVDLRITDSDLRHGYVDVIEPTALVIRSNSAEGYVLELAMSSPLVASSIVRGLESERALGAAGGAIEQRWQGTHSAALSLQFRFILAPGAAEGRYAWPLRVAVRPL